MPRYQGQLRTGQNRTRGWVSLPQVICINMIMSEDFSLLGRKVLEYGSGGQLEAARVKRKGSLVSPVLCFAPTPSISFCVLTSCPPNHHDEMESGVEQSHGVEMTDSFSLLCSDRRDCVGSGEAPVLKRFESKETRREEEHVHMCSCLDL